MTVYNFNDFRRERELVSFEPTEPTLKGGGGGGTSGGMYPANANLEARISRLEGGAVAAVIFLLATFGGGYVLLSNQGNSNTDRLAAKLDTLTEQVAVIRTDAAVLKERSAPKPAK